MNELAKRIGTAAVLLAVVVGALALNEAGIGPAPWMLFVAVACGVAAWEWAGLLGLGRLGQVAYLAASALLVSALMSPALENAVWLAFGLWTIALLRIAGVPFPRTVETLFFGMLGWVAVPVAGLILVAFLGPFVWAFLVIVIVADTAAYFVGHRYGKTALAPEISPGKTRAGLVGALLAVAVVSIPIAWGLGLPLATWFYFACLVLLVGLLQRDRRPERQPAQAPGRCQGQRPLPAWARGSAGSGRRPAGRGTRVCFGHSGTAGSTVDMSGMRLTVLGSSGTIGINTLDLAARHSDHVEVFALAANTDHSTLLEQCRQHRPRYAALANADAARSLQDALRAEQLGTEVLQGEDELRDLAGDTTADCVMAGIVGLARAGADAGRGPVRSEGAAGKQGIAGGGRPAVHG